MKKKLLLAGATLLLAAAAVTGFAAYDKASLLDLMDANVEALTRHEINPDCPNGCQADGRGCHCYEDYPDLKEAEW